MAKLMTPKALRTIKDTASFIFNIKQNPYVTQSYIMALIEHIEAMKNTAKIKGV